jgi:hypothetical protein
VHIRVEDLAIRSCAACASIFGAHFLSFVGDVRLSPLFPPVQTGVAASAFIANSNFDVEGQPRHRAFLANIVPIRRGRLSLRNGTPSYAQGCPARSAPVTVPRY